MLMPDVAAPAAEWLNMNDLNPARWLSIFVCLSKALRNLAAFDTYRERQEADGVLPKVVAPPKPITADNQGGWTLPTDPAQPSKLTRTNFALGTDSAKRSVLLHPHIGIWADNQGRYCYLYDVHRVYGLVVKFLQTDAQPIQPKIAPALRKMMREIKIIGDASAAGGPGAPGGAVFLIFKQGLRATHAALASKVDAEALIERLDSELIELCKGYELFFDYHLGPYMPALMAMELASPFVAASTLGDERTWTGLRLLLFVFGMAFETTSLQLTQMRAHFVERRTGAEERACSENWLAYMDADVERNPQWWHTHPLAMAYVAKVSALTTCSYKAEQKFSEMDHMVGDRKARTAMEVFESALHIKSTKRLEADARKDNDGVGAGNFQPHFLSGTHANV